MSAYLPADRWLLGDPASIYYGREFWISVRRLADQSDFVEKATWFGNPGAGWASPFATDTLHFKITAYMRLDLPEPYHF
jgi:hypothetical protein